MYLARAGKLYPAINSPMGRLNEIAGRTELKWVL